MSESASICHNNQGLLISHVDVLRIDGIVSYLGCVSLQLEAPCAGRNRQLVCPSMGLRAALDGRYTLNGIV